VALSRASVAADAATLAATQLVDDVFLRNLFVAPRPQHRGECATRALLSIGPGSASEKIFDELQQFKPILVARRARSSRDAAKSEEYERYEWVAPGSLLDPRQYKGSEDMATEKTQTFFGGKAGCSAQLGVDHRFWQVRLARRPLPATAWTTS
jgi:hypothetical protein